MVINFVHLCEGDTFYFAMLFSGFQWHFCFKYNTFSVQNGDDSEVEVKEEPAHSTSHLQEFEGHAFKYATASLKTLWVITLLVWLCSAGSFRFQSPGVGIATAITTPGDWKELNI